MIAHAAAHGWHYHATRLAAILFRYLDTCGHYSEAIIMHGHAQTAARLSGEAAAEATALSNLGVAAWRQGRFGSAVASLEQALALFREMGQRTGEARALNNLGDVAWRRGDWARASDRHERALALFRQLGDRFGEADALASLGSVYERLGEDQRAASFHEQALALFRDIGDFAGEADALNRLGEVRLVTARPGAARVLFAAALAVADQIDDKYEQARAHDGLGHCHEADGDLGQARYHWQCAQRGYTELNLADAARRAQEHRVGQAVLVRRVHSQRLSIELVVVMAVDVAAGAGGPVDVPGTAGSGSCQGCRWGRQCHDRHYSRQRNHAGKQARASYVHLLHETFSFWL
jgi:tetratricopeptide (TPR) repeat protein